MSLRNLPKFIQLRSISKSRFDKINTNSDITPPNNLDMVTIDFFCSHVILCLPRHNYINKFTFIKIGVMHKWLQIISSKGGCIT
jgi:hypothetical protein